MTTRNRIDARSRLTTALMIACLSITAIAASAVAQGTSPGAGGPDTPVSSGTLVPAGPGPDGGATVAVPQDGLSDVHPVSWDRVDVASNGQQLTVYYWAGVDTCYGLSSVDVTWIHGTLDIQVQVGSLPGVGACIDMAQYYQTVVQLDQQLITGGYLEE
jgi:hypothetical protein